AVVERIAHGGGSIGERSRIPGGSRKPRTRGPHPPLPTRCSLGRAARDVPPARHPCPERVAGPSTARTIFLDPAPAVRPPPRASLVRRFRPSLGVLARPFGPVPSPGSKGRAVAATATPTHQQPESRSELGREAVVLGAQGPGCPLAARPRAGRCVRRP